MTKKKATPEIPAEFRELWERLSPRIERYNKRIKQTRGPLRVGQLRKMLAGLPENMRVVMTGDGLAQWNRDITLVEVLEEYPEEDKRPKRQAMLFLYACK